MALPDQLWFSFTMHIEGSSARGKCKETTWHDDVLLSTHHHA